MVNHITTGAILGLDFMSEEQCVLNVGHGTLRIDSAGIEVPLSRVPTCGDQEPSVCCQGFLHLVETPLVPAQSEVEVLTASGETLGEGTWLIEGKSTSPHVLIARVVAQTSVGRESTPIHLLNLGPEPLKLYKGTTLAILPPRLAHLTSVSLLMAVCVLCQSPYPRISMTPCGPL